MRRADIAIVGAGYSGTLLAVNLLRHATRPQSILLAERGGSPGRGIAYGTRNPSHLLNVRSAGMSALADDPDHFLHWLEKHGRTGEFVPRETYGTYLEELLESSRAAATPAWLHTVAADIIDLAPSDRGWRLSTAEGRTLEAASVALCLGNIPAPLPCRNIAPGTPAGSVVNDPWSPGALDGIAPDGAVLIVGTGLTMVDVVLALEDRGHRGPVVALSRRGLLPQRHTAAPVWSDFLAGAEPPSTILELDRLVRREIRRARTGGGDWRSVVDAVRPHTHRLWQGLPLRERQRFLRMLRPYWDVHRHRMAPAVADRLDAMRASGRLRIVAGRLASIAADEAGTGLAATFQARGGRAETLRVHAIVNCTGLDGDITRSTAPLIRNLLARGLVRPAPLMLGFDVTEDGRVIDRDGRPQEDLVAVGPLARAPFWEMTAVPDLRAQCARVAARLVTHAKMSVDAPVLSADTASRTA